MRSDVVRCCRYRGGQCGQQGPPAARELGHPYVRLRQAQTWRPTIVPRSTSLSHLSRPIEPQFIIAVSRQIKVPPDDRLSHLESPLNGPFARSNPSVNFASFITHSPVSDVQF